MDDLHQLRRTIRRKARPEQLSALVDSVVGSVPLNKRPLLIADNVEEQLLREGWPTGLMLGGEPYFAKRYGVGRDVFREVVRLLEARNHARMRRGVGGGLEIVLPDLKDLADRLAGYAYVSGLQRSHIVRIWALLQAAAIRIIEMDGMADWQALAVSLVESNEGGARAGGAALIAASHSPVLVTLAHLVADLLPGSADLPLAPETVSILSAARSAQDLLTWVRAVSLPTLLSRLEQRPCERLLAPPHTPESKCFTGQAMRLVHDLMSDISPEQWNNGYLIGNEFDLADHYGVDKSIVRQAIRLMEDAEAATSKQGRGHGLVTRHPSTAPLSRLLCAYLVSRDISINDADRVFTALSIEGAHEAACHATTDDKASLSAMLHDLRNLVGPLPVAVFQSFERLQQLCAHNPLLSLSIDGIKAFLTWRSEPEPIANAMITAAYAKHTKEVMLAICAGDAAAAMRSEATKLAALLQARQQQSSTGKKTPRWSPHHKIVNERQVTGSSI